MIVIIICILIIVFGGWYLFATRGAAPQNVDIPESETIAADESEKNPILGELDYIASHVERMNHDLHFIYVLVLILVIIVVFTIIVSLFSAGEFLYELFY